MHVLRGIERRALVAELVVGLGLVHVVSAARVRVVVDREEEIGMERVRAPHALRQLAAQRAVGWREVVAVVGARHQDLDAAGFEQPAQEEGHAQVDLGLGQPFHAQRAAEEPAVPGIEHHSLAGKNARVRGRQVVHAALVARLGSGGSGGQRWGRGRRDAMPPATRSDGGRGKENAGGGAARPCARSGPHAGAL